MSERRVVITGIGVLAPGGLGREAFWNRIVEGRPATRIITFFDPSAFRSQVAAECDFDASDWSLASPALAAKDRASLLALAALDEALSDSGLIIDEGIASRAGVSLGSAVGATMSLERTYAELSEQGRLWYLESEGADPELYGYMMPSSLASDLADRAGVGGPVRLVSNGCTSGIDAVGHAFDLIVDGEADVMIAGATDAPISPISVACFDAIRATTPRNDDPGRASRPFHEDRDGFVLGEGAAVLVLEELGTARSRGAHIYAEIRSFAARSNAFHMTGLRPDGAELSQAIDAALGAARCSPEQVTYVNAHGSGTRQNDVHETGALKRSLGQHAYSTWVSSIKAVVGHSLGAIGSIEIAACALVVDRGVVPPTASLDKPDPALGLDFVPVEARRADIDHVLTVGSGFGGFQSAMVLAGPKVVA